jgi:hypothetical protein
MTEETKKYQLIVRQRPAADEDLEELLKVLQNEFGLESYTARQRLIGQGLAMFGKGSMEQCRKIAVAVQRHNYPCWIVTPPALTITPDRLRNLAIEGDSVEFTCSRSTARLSKGARVVALLADVSGELGGKLVKRMISQKTYRGHVPADVLEREQLLKLVYQGRPVLDFYIFDSDGLQGAVRVFPGKFNHTGLGERAGLSAIQNLNTLRLLLEEYAGDYRLHMDFGLGHMPECQLSRASDPGGGKVTKGDAEARENQAALSDNLKSLTRYGSLVMQLEGSGLPQAHEEMSEAGLAAGVAATAVVGNPALGAVLGQGEGAAGMPGLDEIARELKDAIGDEPGAESKSKTGASVEQDLPAPPDKPGTPVNLSHAAKIIAGIFAGLTITVGSGGDDLLRLVSRYGMTAGVVPAIVSAALFWSGFYFIILKRQIENTPTSKVRSIAMGMVEVHGRTRRAYALISPISHAACAWYRIRKYRKDSRGNWKVVREENSSHVPFMVDDGTGEVTVNPAGASIKARTKHTSYPGQSGMTFSGSSFGENEKWIEELVYEGTSVYVLGYAQPLRTKKGSLRERTMAKLRQLKLDPQAMRRYDTNGDGQVDQAEWEAARSDAERMALEEHLGEQGERKRQEEHVVIADPPQKRLPFVVAEAESEAHLTSRYGWFSVPLLLGGIAALVLAIYKFLQFLKL